METLEIYWNDIPKEKENAATYVSLTVKWGCKEREVRRRLHELSLHDFGDDYILIRSSHGKGFYKTRNVEEIEAYKRECVSRSNKVLAPVDKINIVLQRLRASVPLRNISK